MPRRAKWLALLAVAAIACASVAAVDAATSASPCGDNNKPVRMVFTGFAANNTWTVAQVAALRKAVKSCGNVKMTWMDAGYDATKQVALLQDAIVSGKYNGFLIESNDGNAMVPVVQQAVKKGIKVVGLFTAIGPNFNTLKPQVKGQTSHIGTTITSQGKNIGTLAVEACGSLNPCKVAYVLGAVGVPLETVRFNGFKATIAPHKNIQLVASPSGDESTATTQTVTQDLLQAHPDINVIASSGDQMTRGAELAVDAAGYTGKVKLIGSGGSTTGVAAVRSGRWFGTALLLPSTEARVGAQTLIAAVRGSKVPASIDSRRFSPLGGSMIADRATLKKYPKFKGEWLGAG